MKTEKEKMLAGELYNALDPQLTEERTQARLLLKALNESREDQPEERLSLLRQLLPHAADGLWIQPPFYCETAITSPWAKRCSFTLPLWCWT
ncbi:maltose acetyltransferase domain-containing protein [Rufibacter quisquiliarum]|uniref:Acetyltransferase n=1 Tax=Rufibacter quisquiliarum TaxID=1549639 RepID=A0A839GT50_9BACT|nr:hypothetical protein [Rufibacter quisquiliarum]